jgi:hypothetical protein
MKGPGRQPRRTATAAGGSSGASGPTPERQGRGQLAETRTYEFEPDEAGRLVRHATRTLRDLNATAAGRLAKSNLTRGQIMAAALFERDHETARLEPSLTVNLAATGGGGGRQADTLPAAVLDARNRQHAALSALRAAGPTVVGVVEEVVLAGLAVTAVGAERHADRRAAKAWAGLALEVGLTLLEGHYRALGRMA